MLDHLAEHDASTGENILRAMRLRAIGNLERYLAYVEEISARQIQHFPDDGTYSLAPHGAMPFGQLYVRRLVDNRSEKQAIARYVVGELAWIEGAKGIREAESVLLDAGTSTTYVALELKEAEAEPGRILTNNLHAATELLHAEWEVWLAGGYLNPQYAATTDPDMASALFREDTSVAVVAATFLCSENAIGCTDVNQRPIKRSVIEAGLRGDALILIADHSKFIHGAPPVPSIFEQLPAKDELWANTRAGAWFVTDMWRPTRGDPRRKIRQYVRDITWFAEEFQDRMIVLDPEGQPLASPDAWLDQLKATARS